LECTNIPAEHVRRETSLNTAEQKRDTNATETDTAIKRVPSGDLRTCLHNVGQLERHNSKDGIVLTVARITHGDSDDGRPPVANEALSTGIENGLTADCLGTSSVDQLIVVENGTVTGRKMVTLFISALATGLGRLVFSALATAFCTLDVIKFEVDNLVDNDTANTSGPKGVWGCVLNSVISVSVSHTLLVLKLWLVPKVLRKSMVLAISTQSGSELGLSKEANLPVQLSGHLAVSIHPSKLRNLRVHLARVLDHLLHG
jgi:hypothetical protein